MGKSKIQKAPKKSNPLPEEPPDAEAASMEVAELVGSEEDYEKFQSLAMAVDLRDGAARRQDVALACHNAKKGAAAVLEDRARIKKDLPAIDIAHLEAIPAIASALAFAELRLEHMLTPDTGIRDLVRRGRALRRVLLTSARALAAAGLLAPKAVRAIEIGKGDIDMAKDAMALAALFTSHAKKLSGKTAITPALVKEAAQVGAKLNAVLKPQRAKKEVKLTPEQAQATDMRDRFWLLLNQRYDLLWRAGAYLYGKSTVDTRVPPLQAFAGRRRNTAAEPAPEGEPTPG